MRSTLERLKFLPALFRKIDVEKITPHAAIFLSRAVGKNLIYRLNRGNYVNSFLCGFPPVEAVACFLRPPAYITGEWALNHHGIILQAPFVCTVATLSTAVGKDRRIEYQGTVIEFSRLSRRLFFGFNPVDQYYIATPEKAVLDTIHLRKSLPAPDEWDFEKINQDRLQQMAEKYPSTVTKRLPPPLQVRPRRPTTRVRRWDDGTLRQPHIPSLLQSRAKKR
jgi:predicted transcriptional regulator of viral defense system